MKISRTSIALLTIQLVIVSTIGAKYLYQRQSCPKVWTRTVAYDPELVMRGRYLSTQLKVDACDVAKVQTRSVVKNAAGVPGYLDLANGSTFVQGKIGVNHGKLSVLSLETEARDKNDQQLVWPHSNVCSEVELWSPVDFYLPEHAKSPLPIQAGQELWMEVTVPPKGPPRPIQLAIKRGSSWTPLAFQ